MLCTCGKCYKCKGREANRRWREAHPERAKEVEAARRAKRTAEKAAAQRERYANFDWRAKALEEGRREGARCAVKWALRYGVLVKQPCERCNEPAEAHHEDYDKPLDVVWLCRVHHGERHRQLRTEQEERLVVPRLIKNKSG